MTLADQIIEHGPYKPGQSVRELLAAIPDFTQINALRDELIELRRLSAAAGQMRRLLADLVDPDSCRFDHNGGCQAHGYLWLKPGEKCPNAEAQELLADEHTEGCA